MPPTTHARSGGIIGRTVALCAVVWALPAAAILVGGGGSKRTDCLLAIYAPLNHPPDNPRRVRCIDGDPGCDADGTVDGICSIDVAACANLSFDPRCEVFGVADVEVRYAEDNGDSKFDPDFQGLQSRIDGEIDPPTSDPDVCTATSPPRTDKDKPKLICEPAPVDGCDPLVLFGGTFDRIQRKVFDQSCAVSGCHDSQTLAGAMTLGSGTAICTRASTCDRHPDSSRSTIHSTRSTRPRPSRTISSSAACSLDTTSSTSPTRPGGCSPLTPSTRGA